MIDLDDPRCARHFTLSRMHEALERCLGQPQACPLYYRLQAEQRAQIRLTLFGEPVAAKLTAAGGHNSGGGAGGNSGGGGGLRRTGT
jgi:hypothetical protein